jgi:methylmalonyl-CoA/ethylmalonyl-CoA epimerase
MKYGDAGRRAHIGQNRRNQSEVGRQCTVRSGSSGVRLMSDAMEQVPGFLFVDHVAVSVRVGELEPQVAVYKAMGFKEVHREDVLGTDQVREVLLQIGNGPNMIQLLEPLTPESPVAKQLEKNGGRGGLAHVAFRVVDIQKAFDYLKEKGFNIIDKTPRKGSRETTVFFVHPKTTDTTALGYLLEVVQEGTDV